jgi:GTPase
VLAVLVDLAEGTALPSPGEQARILEGELGRYRPELLDRPRLIIGSRADAAGGDARAEAAVEEAGIDVVLSAVTRQGVPELVGRLGELVDGARQVEPASDGFVIHRPVGEGVRVERADDGSFQVTGRQAERAVALSDLTNPDALDFAHFRLKKLGVDRALARAGATEGDVVRIGSLSFTFEPDEV